jgi:hypothetical protein
MSRGALARARGLWEGKGVDRQALVSAFSGVLGGLAGAAFVLLVTQKEALMAREAVAHVRVEMQGRLKDIDKAIDALEQSSDGMLHGADALGPRVQVLPPTLASADGVPVNAALPAVNPRIEPAALDVAQRSDAERAVAQEALRRHRDKYWADELTMRLGLTPAQTERLVAIQAQLATDLDAVRSETADGRYVSRDSRRAARRAARLRADEQLRAIFTRQQVSAYEALDGKLQLYRQRDPD